MRNIWKTTAKGIATLLNGKGIVASGEHPVHKFEINFGHNEANVVKPNMASAEFIGSALQIIVVTEFKCYDSYGPFDSLLQGEDDATN